MWERLNYKFKQCPARKSVAWKMVELGLRIDKDSKIYCGNLKINDVALANAANVDRRAVKATVKTILDDEQLSKIFKNIIPAGTLLKNIAKNLGLGVVEIEVGQENTGILAEASKIISTENISIRQAYASDIKLGDTPILTIITEEPVEGNLINKLLKIKGITRVSIY